MSDWNADIARRAYGREEGQGPEYEHDYGPIIDSLGRVVLRIDDEDYQGDTRLLLKDGSGSKWGLCVIGWGSCSGCDALQAAESWEVLAELRNEIAGSVVWHDSGAEMLAYINEKKDWEGSFLHEEETNTFLRAARAVLGEDPLGPLLQVDWKNRRATIIVTFEGDDAGLALDTAGNDLPGFTKQLVLERGAELAKARGV